MHSRPARSTTSHGEYAPTGLPVFPGAQGFGVDTPAGRGGRIVPVNSLASSGPGTLREALEASGPRIVVFEVGGVIDLECQSLTISDPYLTVAGQTAPAPGITLIRGGINICTHDVLIQHLRVRPGDAGQAKDSGWEPDGITTTDTGGAVGPHHVVVDHCSISWGVDENLSASGPRHRGREGTSHLITFSNCIIAEALFDSTHPKGWHSKGTLIHDHVRDVAVVRNLYASNADRNPVLKSDASAVVVNNLIYNPGKWALHSYWNLHENVGREHEMRPCELVAVGNVMWRGPDTPDAMRMFEFAKGKCCAYLADNRERDGDGYIDGQMAEPHAQCVDEKLLWPDGLDVLPSEQTADHVLTNAGAWPAARDEVDQRIIDAAVSRTGRIIDSQDEVGGYPDLTASRHTLDIPADPHAIAGEAGYTRVEHWLHERAAAAESVNADSATRR